MAGVDWTTFKPPTKLGAGHVSRGKANKMSVSESLKTSAMWITIGHDPYASADTDKNGAKAAQPSGKLFNGLITDCFHGFPYPISIFSPQKTSWI